MTNPNPRMPQFSEPGVDPVQPTDPVFAIPFLYRSKVWDRPTFEKVWGMQAPPFDPNLPGKGWFDTAPIEAGVDPSADVTYNWYNPTTHKIETFTITAKWAAYINLPGDYRYDPYKVEATDATFLVPPFTATFHVDPTLISSKEEADRLQAEWNSLAPTAPAGTVTEVANYIGSGMINWGTEKRRLYEVQNPTSGARSFAGTLIKEENVEGVGHPGTWDLTSQLWHPDGTTAAGQVVKTVTPFPVRALLPDEEIQVGMMGDFVHKKDVITGNTQPAPGLSPDEHTKLLRIAVIMEKLNTTLNLGA